MVDEVEDLAFFLDDDVCCVAGSGPSLASNIAGACTARLDLVPVPLKSRAPASSSSSSAIVDGTFCDALEGGTREARVFSERVIACGVAFLSYAADNFLLSFLLPVGVVSSFESDVGVLSRLEVLVVAVSFLFNGVVTRLFRALSLLLRRSESSLSLELTCWDAES